MLQLLCTSAPEQRSLGCFPPALLRTPLGTAAAQLLCPTPALLKHPHLSEQKGKVMAKLQASGLAASAKSRQLAPADGKEVSKPHPSHGTGKEVL